MPVSSLTIPAQSGVAFRLSRGDRLKVIDPEGQQVSDLFCLDAADSEDALSSGRSMDYADTIFLTRGHTLYSNRSRPMLKILEDSCGRHDFLLTPCSLKMFQIVAGDEEYHPSCHENLVTHLARFGVRPDQITTTFNIFMNVSVSPEGRIAIEPPRSQAGDHVLFEAQMDLIVGLTACSHEGTNNSRCRPILYEILAGR